jgi:hypothetical protein
MVPGFTTSSKTRPLLISKLETYFRERSVIIKSARLAEELYVFIWNGSRPEAQNGYNDDLVISLAIGLWVRDTALKLRQEGLFKTRMSLEYLNKSTIVQNSQYTNFNSPQQSWKMDVNGSTEDLNWLIK